MLITSDFHDYYDVIMAQGVDKSIVYNRKQEIFYTKDEPKQISGVPVISQERSYYPYDQIPNLFLIGCCGKFYPAISFHASGDSIGSTILYTPEQVRNVADISLTGSTRKHFFGMNRKSHWFKSPAENVEIFFKQHPIIEKPEPFIAIKAPIIVRQAFSPSSVTVNAKLADYQFYKVIDPYTLFQEISMFISGVLGIEPKETVQISDIDMAAKKGFNEKSFRTDPGTRKPRWLKRELRGK